MSDEREHVRGDEEPRVISICESTFFKTREAMLMDIGRIVHQILQDLGDGKLPLQDSPGEDCSLADSGDVGQVSSGCARAPSVRWLAVWLRVLARVTELLATGKHCTLRDLYYWDVQLFRDQTTSGRALESLSRMLGVRRNLLQVTAAPKGLVFGDLSFVENGTPVSCLACGASGKSILPAAEICDLQSRAAFVLVVEKEAIFSRLIEDNFWRTHRCILVTGKGFPDLATQEFVRFLIDRLQLPCFGLVDADPFGVSILHLYAEGNSARPDHALTRVPTLRWLGVRPGDTAAYSIPAACAMPLTAADRQRGESLARILEAEGSPWVSEVREMLVRGTKMEIEALMARSLGYLAEEYLPRKLRERDWI